ncbi:MAG: FHA domain-containing protein, partial [Verrucomicrobia bacterium]|nr:FHA domain-containing protein [Verrucomicrobiota bacterium]
MTHFRLTATLESGQQISVLLEEGIALLGRDPTCPICLPSDSVSRNHARLTLAAESLILEDLDSTAGTFAKEQALTQPVELTYPATFQVGPIAVTVAVTAQRGMDTTMVFDEGTSATTATPAATGAGNYVIRREIARGGMGAILSATDQTLDREVAMKVMLEAGEQDPIARQRFLREALVLARL